MSSLSKSAVVQAFLADHRKFMRLLLDTGLALDAGDTQRARGLARTLNEVAGPHIAFEEAVLYPALDESTHERAFVDTLYDEHQSIIRGLAQLMDDLEPDEASLRQISAAIHDGIQHAEHCGTLVSRLSALDEADQREALDELKQLRASGMKWTDLKKEV